MLTASLGVWYNKIIKNERVIGMKKRRVVWRAISCAMVLLLCLCTMVACRSEKDDVQAPAVVVAIEADAVRYYKGTENYAFFVMEKDGVFRLIDHKGEAVSEETFTYIGFGEPEPYDTEVKLHTYAAEGAIVTIEADGSLGEQCTGIFGYGGEGVTAVWHRGKAAVTYNDSDGWIGEYSVAEYRKNARRRCPGTVAIGTPKVVAVREVLTVTTDENYEGAEFADEYSDRYALMDVESGRLISDFIYEEHDRVGMVDGLIAVKKDGKWGYVRADGTAATAFVYEMISDQSGREQLYAPVNGYVAVKKDGKFGLIDTDGNVVVGAQYDDITQVNGDGYYWFAKDGTWSSAKVDG